MRAFLFFFFFFIPGATMMRLTKRLGFSLFASGIPYIVLYNSGWSQHQHHIGRGYPVHVSCLRVYKVGVWYPNFLHNPACKRNRLIKIMSESFIDPLLSKKYVDCVILEKKSARRNN